MPERILRGKEAVRRSGLSATTLWRLEKAGKFPKKRKLSSNAVGTLESEFCEWMESPEEWVEKHCKEGTA